MSHHIKDTCPTQATFFPEVLDDFISTENSAALTSVYVDELDLGNWGGGVIPKDTGLPNYHPVMILHLYLYGYLNHIYSSRKLEREVNRNIE